MVGRNISHYQVLQLLGEGSMGSVYRALDTRLNREVALKFMQRQAAASPAARERFRREALTTAALTHPNCATVFSVEEMDGESFLAMEYLPGGTIVSLGRPLPVGDVVRIGLEVARGLAAAHARGIVHRDIKPSNLMLHSDGRVMITDFGIARFADSPGVTSTGVSVGTAAYMSPEQVLGASLDGRSDIFSLGVVLYELAAGESPFHGANAAVFLHEVINTDPAPMSMYRPGIDPGLEAIVRRCLEKSPDKRYATALDLANDFEDFQRSGEGPTRVLQRTHSKVGPRRSTPKGRRFPTALASFAAAALAAALTLFLWSRRAESYDSLAVLPFEITPADTSMDYLSEGLTNSLIDDLSQLSRVTVIARSSVFQFKGAKGLPEEAGRKLGVKAVLVGSLRRHGGKTIVNAELVGVRRKQHLWGAEYERTDAELPALQAEIALEISTRLHVEMSGEEQSRLGRSGTSNPQAYEMYLRGQQVLGNSAESGQLDARRYFQKSVDLDPNYALAWAGLATADTWLSTLNPQVAIGEARAAVSRALAIDPNLAGAHLASAMILWQYDYAWQDAERSFRRATELNPGLEIAHELYGYFLMASSRFDEAGQEFVRARALDPLSVRAEIYQGAPDFERGRYAEAAQAFARVLEHSPRDGSANCWLGWTYSHLGRYDEALAHLRLAASDGSDDPLFAAELARTFALAGKRDSAEAILKGLEDRSRTEYVPSFTFSKIQLALGDAAAALDRLEQGFEVHDLGMVWIGVDPDFKTLHGNPRFEELLKRVRVPT